MSALLKFCPYHHNSDRMLDRYCKYRDLSQVVKPFTLSLSLVFVTKFIPYSLSQYSLSMHIGLLYWVALLLGERELLCECDKN